MFYNWIIFDESQKWPKATIDLKICRYSLKDLFKNLISLRIVQRLFELCHKSGKYESLKFPNFISRSD